MSALEQEVLEKFRLLDKEARKRINRDAICRVRKSHKLIQNTCFTLPNGLNGMPCLFA